jgi:CCR4-NOT transcription complex subunit 1
MERVIEWPQYCNHILQISHLRGTRSRLVLEIEQELNKISVSQNDTNLNAMIPEDQRVSVTQFTENAEVFTSICCKNYRLFLLVVCHFNLSKLTIIF